MNHAKWLAILVCPAALLGCGTPCTRLAAQTVALDKYCAEVAREEKDQKLAFSCAQAYVHMTNGLTEGTCASRVKR